jgi:hypothetical protein
MDRCASCGAGLAGPAWCGQCFAAVATTGAAATGAATIGTFGAGSSAPQPFVPGRAVPTATPERLVRRTRWAKTTTTFGPVGRVVVTVAVIIPLLLMIAGGFADPFAWAGAGIWGVIIVPWALRDIWREGVVPIH